jgi:hypothetical protein
VLDIAYSTRQKLAKWIEDVNSALLNDNSELLLTLISSGASRWEPVTILGNPYSLVLGRENPFIIPMTIKTRRKSIDRDDNSEKGINHSRDEELMHTDMISEHSSQDEKSIRDGAESVSLEESEDDPIMIVVDEILDLRVGVRVIHSTAP